MCCLLQDFRVENRVWFVYQPIVGRDMEPQLARVSAETVSEKKNLPKENKKKNNGEKKYLTKENQKMNNGAKVNEPIKFGSHKEEGQKVPVVGQLKDAVEDWPEPKQIHSFYIVRYRRFEDQNLKPKYDQAEKELQKLNQARFQLIEKLRAKKVSFVHRTSISNFERKKTLLNGEVHA